MTRPVVYSVPLKDRPPVQVDFGPPPTKQKRRRVAVPYAVRRERYLREPGNHGTKVCYHDWRCRCVKCKAAWAKAWRDTRAERFTRELPATALHGKESTYNNYGCRCDDCREAHNAGKSSRDYQRVEEW